jgi:hypothetical protein
MVGWWAPRRAWPEQHIGESILLNTVLMFFTIAISSGVSVGRANTESEDFSLSVAERPESDIDMIGYTTRIEGGKNGFAKS